MGFLMTVILIYCLFNWYFSTKETNNQTVNDGGMEFFIILGLLFNQGILKMNKIKSPSNLYISVN